MKTLMEDQLLLLHSTSTKPIVISDTEHWPLNTRKHSQSALGRLVSTSPPKRFKMQGSGGGDPSKWLGKQHSSNPLNNNLISSSPIIIKKNQPSNQITTNQDQEPRITINTSGVTNNINNNRRGSFEGDEIQFASPEKKRGGLALEGCSIEIAPSLKDSSISRSSIELNQSIQSIHQHLDNNNNNNATNSPVRSDSTMNSSSPSKKETIQSNIALLQDSSPIKKITYDIVMPSMSFYQLENKEAFDQHYREISPSPTPSRSSTQVRPPKYDHLQSINFSLQRKTPLNSTIEIEKSSIRPKNNSQVVTISSSTSTITVSSSQNVIPSTSTFDHHHSHHQTRLPNIHQKTNNHHQQQQQLVFDKNGNTLSLVAVVENQPNTRSILSSSSSSNTTTYHREQTKPSNNTPTISCTALSGFIFSKVHGVQNMSPTSYSKRYQPTTQSQSAKKPFFHGNAKKPYNGLIEISSFTKNRKKTNIDPNDSYT